MKLPISLLLTVICIFGIQTISAQKIKNKINRRIVVSDCPLWQRPIDLPRPKFPNAARLVHASGKIGVQLLIDEKGNVEKAEAVSGHLLLRTAAVEAALKAKFNPFIIGGRAVSCSSFIEYNFVADLQVRKTSVRTNPPAAPFQQSNITTEKNQINVFKGKAISLPKPVVPLLFEETIERNPYVLVEIAIDENGSVISAKAFSGHPLLRRACEAAAGASRFSQTRIAGIPVKAKALITYQYILDEEIWVNVIVNSIEAQQ